MSEGEAQVQAFVLKAYRNLGDSNMQSGLRTTMWMDNRVFSGYFFLGEEPGAVKLSVASPMFSPITSWYWANLPLLFP